MLLLLLFTKFGDVLLGALTSYEGPNIFMDSLYPALCLSPIVGLVLSIKSSSENNGRKHSDIRSARMNIERSENSLAYHEKFLRSYLPELNRAQNYLNSINRMSSEFYKTNYIHPNYRSLIPISSIFNYIETGQCSTLQGPNGAYRMHEQDALQGAIITRLDVVIEKWISLSQIREI